MTRQPDGQKASAGILDGVSFNFTRFRDSAPYPEVTGGKDPYTVSLLKRDYAGASGELTAITTYIYQNISSADNERFANTLRQIAIVEMSHLDMLGGAIAALGGDARFSSGGAYWSADNVNHVRSLKGILQGNIKAETKAISSYERHARQTGNKSVRALLLRIATDERLHRSIFRAILEQVNA